MSRLKSAIQSDALVGLHIRNDSIYGKAHVTNDRVNDGKEPVGLLPNARLLYYTFPIQVVVTYPLKFLLAVS